MDDGTAHSLSQRFSVAAGGFVPRGPAAEAAALSAAASDSDASANTNANPAAAQPQAPALHALSVSDVSDVSEPSVASSAVQASRAPPPFSVAVSSANPAEYNSLARASSVDLSVANDSLVPSPSPSVRMTDALALARSNTAATISFPSRSKPHSRAASPVPAPNGPAHISPSHPPLAPPLAPASMLPTRAWLLKLHFHDIPAVDPVSSAIQKAFPFNSGVRPVRTLLQIHKAQQQQQHQSRNSGKNSDGELARVIICSTLDREALTLEALMLENSWRAVALHCATVIPTLDPSHIDHINAFWLSRLIALHKLNLHDILAVELQVLSDCQVPLSASTSEAAATSRYKQFLYESYPEGTFVDAEGRGITNRKGSLVDWNIRTFWALEPNFRGDSIPSGGGIGARDAIGRMYMLVNECAQRVRSSGLDAQEKRMWTMRARRLQICVADLLVVDILDFGVARSLLVALLESAPQSGAAATPDDVLDILVRLARLSLQAGDTQGASTWTQKLEEYVTEHPDAAAHAKDATLMHQALLEVARDGNWTGALGLFEQLMQRDRSGSKTVFASVASETVVNNMAVCSLYSGNVAQALSRLELLLQENPRAVANLPALLFNLATLYDLVDNSLERKRALLGGFIATYSGDDLDAACLKLGV
ncbi:hypothetical protein HDU83_001185 [Entophlyctis luteolus]|nr:hypothetical protein HDU83_001185 [Entophlyctis luteolus]